MDERILGANQSVHSSQSGWRITLERSVRYFFHVLSDLRSAIKSFINSTPLFSRQARVLADDSQKASPSSLVRSSAQQDMPQAEFRGVKYGEIATEEAVANEKVQIEQSYIRRAQSISQIAKKIPVLNERAVSNERHLVDFQRCLLDFYQSGKNRRFPLHGTEMNYDQCNPPVKFNITDSLSNILQILNISEHPEELYEFVQAIVLTRPELSRPLAEYLHSQLEYAPRDKKPLFEKFVCEVISEEVTEILDCNIIDQPPLAPVQKSDNDRLRELFKRLRSHPEKYNEFISGLVNKVLSARNEGGSLNLTLLLSRTLNVLTLDQHPLEFKNFIKCLIENEIRSPNNKGGIDRKLNQILTKSLEDQLTVVQRSQHSTFCDSETYKRVGEMYGVLMRFC